MNILDKSSKLQTAKFVVDIAMVVTTIATSFYDRNKKNSEKDKKIKDLEKENKNLKTQLQGAKTPWVACYSGFP